MNLQQANLEDILSFYYEGTPAPQIEEALLRAMDAGHDSWLKRILRNHDVPVTDRQEIEFRDGMDDLIVCWNVIEIAALSGLIQVDVSRPQLWRNWRQLLSHNYVRRYYVEYYPERLPQLLLLRLNGEFSQTDTSDGVVGLSAGFLHLDRLFITNHRRKYLLKMFDDFTIGGVGFDAIVGLLEEPQKFVDSLFKEEESKTIVDYATQELSQFIGFCFSFKDLLDAAEGHELLQGEIWARYAYWFELIGAELQHRLGRALDKFLSWQPTHGGEEALAEVQDYVREGHRVFNVLFSSRYTEVMDTILRGKSEGDSGMQAIACG